MKSVAIIGTAGRDRRPEYTQALFWAMYGDAYDRFDESKRYKLVSGGAAWADHIAVELFLTYPAMFELELYLPAPLSEKGVYEGERASAGSVSNWYHEMFRDTTGVDGRKRILRAKEAGAVVAYQDKAPGMAAFFIRNAQVAAASDACLAYTWGDGKEPADGGTKDTWNKLGPEKRRVHVPLRKLCVP